MTLSGKPSSMASNGDAECPICEAKTAAEYAPFCSKRCADIDLHRWLNGAYAIPATETEFSDDQG